MPIIEGVSTTRPWRIVRAIRLDAKDPDAYHERALAYADKGDLDRAIAAFTEAIRLDRKPATAYKNRGLAYRNKGQFDEAIADFTEVIRLDPKSARAFADRASVRIRKREFDAAIGDYTEATRLAPSDWRAYFRRGFAPRRAISTAPSRTSPRCSSAIRPPPQRTNTAARLLEERGVPQGGCRLYRGHSARPQGARGRTKAATSSKFRRGKLDEAVAERLH